MEARGHPPAVRAAPLALWCTILRPRRTRRRRLSCSQRGRSCPPVTTFTTTTRRRRSSRSLFDAEARACWRREEADAVRQVREYEVARREERVRRVKMEIVELDASAALPSTATTSTAARRGPRGRILGKISSRWCGW
ncbi:hypothetical protein QYE76_050626 [Lolium multiflorum]|uniref:Uncharacterized protein n=1 Tax=Lolium multiflorum TaxID=4521 RepID=A0AAD8WH59_LOLMU|nr:hypothetical protein QYE76_050626 [Lolium multiflorum]